MKPAKRIYHYIAVEPADTMPIGSVVLFPGRRAPDGFIICDGRTMEIAWHPKLFAAIGHNFTEPLLTWRLKPAPWYLRLFGAKPREVLVSTDYPQGNFSIPQLLG